MSWHRGLDRDGTSFFQTKAGVWSKLADLVELIRLRSLLTVATPTEWNSNSCLKVAALAAGAAVNFLGRVSILSL